jgi:hypothetical protein
VKEGFQPYPTWEIELTSPEGLNMRYFIDAVMLREEAVERVIPDVAMMLYKNLVQEAARRGEEV